MVPEVQDFVAAFAATLVAVVTTAALGRGAKRRAHVASAAVTTVLLVLTVVFAERLGRALVIPRLILVVHLVFANLATLAFLCVLVTGGRLFRRPEAARRRWHRRAIVLFLVLVACATATGTYMLSRATPRGRTSGHASSPRVVASPLSAI